MTTPLLDTIETPADVRRLPETELPRLAAEIRERMVDVVSRTGGHLAPSLGTIELTIALCRTFNFPEDTLIWDVGHQSYAWKMLTGRNAQMETLRQFGGVRGFPFPEESPFDASVGGHAGVALSTALGHAAARDARGRKEHVLAVVGDASLTNGVSLEALNAIRHTTERMILVINDNGMSISQNVGAFARMFARRISGIRYNRIRAAAEAAGHKLRLTGLKSLYRAVKQAIKPLLLRHRSAIFEDLGLRYIGPIDGHDIPALCAALQSAAEGHVPVALHIATTKGKGYAPAERNPSKWHGVSPWATASATSATQTPLAWSEAFGEALCELAREDARIVAITAAMRDGTGLANFFREFPHRAYDVGICEEHAVAFASGLAAAGLRPFVALYSTFAQRSVDCMMHDVCLPKLPVTLCLDRAGIVGADGPTHHGLYDIAMLRALPNLAIYAPATKDGLKQALRTALLEGTPTVIRYPRGTVIETLPPSLPLPADVNTPCILALGDTAAWVASLATDLQLPYLAIERIKPLPECLESLKGRPLITIENAAAQAGFGSAIAEVHDAPILILGWGDDFIPQGSERELRTWGSLDDNSLRSRITTFMQELAR
jgi:1-deoxy-D-xylulose-5-phosphate synthase